LVKHTLYATPLVSKVSTDLPFQAFNKFAGGLEEVPEALGHGLLPPLSWSFTLLCVERTEAGKKRFINSEAEE